MKRVFSGVQPTGNIHLGNYLGALKQFVELQEDHECIYCIVDMHAITVPQEPKVLKEHILDVAALYLAVGLDPEKSIVFVQSDVPGHAELSWILTCSSYTGELSRMTQFKDKSKNKESAPSGLFMYPVLMAADILLYDTHVVPALDDPTKKMSKSAENIHSRISLLDEPSKIKKSIMKATTDSEGVIRFDIENKPGISNLLNIYSSLSGISVSDLERQYEGKGYGDFKKDLVEVTVDALAPIRQRYDEIRNSQQLISILKDGAEKADAIAQKTMRRVKENFGLGL